MISTILGRQGSGKTIFLVALAYEEYLKGRTIYSNIHLKFPYEPIDIEQIKNCELENGVVIWDEMHNVLSSRRFMKKLSIIICDGFMSMVRKKDLDVFGTTQLLRKLDVRIRDERDYTFECFKFVFVNNEWINWIRPDREIPKGSPVMIQVDRYDMQTLEKNTIYFNANDFYNLYDTKEIVKIKGVENYD